jgi:hypothetical protein
LKPNLVPSVFPCLEPETPLTAGQQQEQIGAKQAKQDVKRLPCFPTFKARRRVTQATGSVNMYEPQNLQQHSATSTQ